MSQMSQLQRIFIKLVCREDKFIILLFYLMFMYITLNLKTKNK